MANIKIIVEGPLMDGHKVTFKAPCECFEVEKLNVFYVKDNAQVSRLFTMKDTHGNDLTGIGNLFTEGAYVHAILDTTNGFAYIQNADTNGYIEQRLVDINGMIQPIIDEEKDWDVLGKCTSKHSAIVGDKSYCYVHRIGRIVCMYICLNFSSVVEQYDTVFILPEKYKPAIRVIDTVKEGIILAINESTGRVNFQHEIPANTWILQSITYTV